MNYIARVSDTAVEVRSIDEGAIELAGARFHCRYGERDASMVVTCGDDRFRAAVEFDEAQGLIVSIENYRVCVDISRRSIAQARELLHVNDRGASSNSVVVSSPMPGLVRKVYGAAGAFVHAGDVVLILEAMKMENEVKAPFDGTLGEVTAQVGANVEKGRPLFSVERKA